jgi:regulator of sigma E protease
MSILNPILIILEVLLLFNLLIFVHELGHFLAARWRGLKIDRFAIWFGKPIWKTKIKGVEYALGWIPAGGYVALPQMATMETIEGKGDSDGKPLPAISALDKIIVAFAGPLFSFGLALAFAVVVWVVGRPVADIEDTTTIGFVLKNGPADKAGLRAGDVIQSVDGQPVSKWSGMGPSVTWRIVRSEGDTLPVVVKRNGETKSFDVAPSHEPTKIWERKSLRKIQIIPEQVARIDSIYSNSPAALAGLRKGDTILDLNGTRIYCPEGVEDFIEENGTKPVALGIKRGNTNLSVSVVPEIPMGAMTNRASIGVNTWDFPSRLVHPSPVGQVQASLDAMFSTFGALFDRKSDIKAQHLGGAVKILSVYYMLFQDKNGWRLALWFSVLMNVNLALLNMLPIPVLDGGHIVLAIVEAIRRKPISARIVGVIQTGCAVALIGFMIYIAFYDVQELPWKRSKDEKPVDIKFTPKPATRGTE